MRLSRIFFLTISLLIFSNLLINKVEAAQITSLSNQLSRTNETIVASHIIKGVTTTGVTAGQTITVTFPGSSFAFGGSYNNLDMALAQGSTSNCDTATFTAKTIGASASGATWGATYATNVVTFTSGTDTIPANRCIRINLNSNGAGHTLTNPTVASNTVYNINVAFGNSADVGQLAVIILNDTTTPDPDQIQINSLVMTAINLDIDTVNNNCNNNTEASTQVVNLGLLTPGVVKRSDATINFICLDVGTNATLGVQLFTRSNRNNATGGLVSGGSSIPSATANLNNVGVTSGYGVRVAALGTPEFGTFTSLSPFNSVTAGSVGGMNGLLGSATQFAESTAPARTGASSRIALEVAAKAASTTTGGLYTDMITITVLVNF